LRVMEIQGLVEKAVPHAEKCSKDAIMRQQCIWTTAPVRLLLPL
jgi:hypothetical protein